MITNAFDYAYEWYYGSKEENTVSNCVIGEEYELPLQSLNIKNKQRVVRKGKYVDGTAVNIYSVNGKECIKNFKSNVKFLKTLRHPNIVQYISHVTTKDECHLITEKCYPLSTLISKMDANEICSGLYDIAVALKFLHSQVKTSHNNVAVGSIYVNKKGVWKLGDFDFATTFENTTERNLFAPECLLKVSENKKLHCKFDKLFSYSSDVNSFGILIKEYQYQIQFATGVSKEKFSIILKDITRDDYTNRPTMAEILTMPVLKSNFKYIINFLQAITLKQQCEKDQFFTNLVKMLSDSKIYSHVFARCIVPLLLTPIVMGEQKAISFVIQKILKPKNKGNPEGLIPDEEFSQYVIPKISELFKSRVLHVRLVLIKYLEFYIHLFDKQVLHDFIIPELIVGMNDANNELVKETLVALASTIPVVGADIILGDDREKIFHLATPKFNGSMLNGQSVLTHQETFTERKPFTDTKEKEVKKKLTLFEIAQKNKKYLTNIKQLEIREKQNKSSNSLNLKKNSWNGIDKVNQDVDFETWAESSDESNTEGWSSFDV